MLGYEPLPKTIQVIDFDRRKGSINDFDVVEFLGETYGLRHPSDLQLYTKERRNEILQATKEFGASIKQLFAMQKGAMVPDPVAPLFNLYCKSTKSL